MSDAHIDEGEAVSESVAGEEERRVFGIPLPKAIAGASILIFFVLWEVLSRLSYSSLDLVFPSLVDIFGAFSSLVVEAEFYHHLSVTAQEIGIAFLLASVVGIGLGSIIGSSRFLAAVLEPIIYYFSTVPKIILYPSLIAIFGAASIESKIAVGFLSAIFPIIVNTIAGARGVRDDLIKVAKVNKASYLDIFTKVYAPSMIPNIVNGLRLGIGVAIIGTLFAELFVSQAGLGHRIAFYFSNLHVDRMYAIILFIFIVSFAINLAILGIQKALQRRGYGTGGSEESFGF